MNKAFMIAIPLFFISGFTLKQFEYIQWGNTLMMLGYISLIICAVLVIRDVVMKVIAIIMSIMGIIYLITNIILQQKKITKMYEVFQWLF